MAKTNENPRHVFRKVSCCELAAMHDLIETGRPDAVLRLAAGSHLGRFIDASGNRIGTDSVGVSTLVHDVLHNVAGWHELLITYVTERPGHNFRHAVDASKLRRELAWTPQEKL